jgi:aspartate racemase
MSSAYFYALITSLTDASCDQEHIDIVLSSRAQTPDRTAYILDNAKPSPLPQMLNDAARLVAFGADVIAMPCNTAHYFYESLAASVPVPFINIVDEASRAAVNAGAEKVGVLATSGTVKSRTYHTALEKLGAECITPDEREQAFITELIYGSVKKGKLPDYALFKSIADWLCDKGCEKIILGCTELSLIGCEARGDVFVDSLRVLAESCIIKCGKKVANPPAPILF